MAPVRVLIVDDSVTVRLCLSEALARDAEIEIAGTAANGRVALARIERDAPDVVVLDLEMPEMGGLETLRNLRRDFPALPVIVFSALTQRGGAATLEALSLGAADYVTKPQSSGGSTGLAAVCDGLATRIKFFGRTRTPSRHACPRRSAAAGLEPVELVAIGTSTGGPNALEAVLSELPADFPAPIVIVQHMPPLFTSLLAERLNSRSPLRVVEARAGDRLCGGTASIAPGGHHMIVARRRGLASIEIHDEPPENSCRPSVDVLFRSVAIAYGKAVLAVVLTGMGQDGLAGAAEIARGGGEIIAQDEPTSVVWGMPGAVARAGLAHQVLPLRDVAGALIRRVCIRPKGAPPARVDPSALVEPLHSGAV